MMSILNKKIPMIFLVFLSVIFSAPTIDFSNAPDGTFEFVEDEGGIDLLTPVDLEELGVITGTGNLSLVICDYNDLSGQIDCASGLQSASFSDNEVAGISYVVTATISENIKIAIDIPENYNGNASMHFQVSDDSNEVAQGELIITVGAKDDQPQFIGEVVGLTPTVDKSINFLDEDNNYGSFIELDGDFILWSQLGGSELEISFPTPGNLNISQPENWDGRDTVILKTKDLTMDGLYDTAQFIFIETDLATFITPVDDVTTIDIDESQFLTESIVLTEDIESTFDYSTYINDFISDEVSYLNEPTNLQISFGENSFTVKTKVDNWNGTESVEFRIFNEELGAFIDTASATFIINAIDDDPVIEDLPIQVINATELSTESNFNIFNLKTYLSEVDGDEVSISWSSNTELESLYIDPFTDEENQNRLWTGILSEFTDDMTVYSAPSVTLEEGESTEVTFSISDVGSSNIISKYLEFRINSVPTLDGDWISPSLTFVEDVSILSQNTYFLIDYCDCPEPVLHCDGNELTQIECEEVLGQWLVYNSDSITLSDSLKLPWADTLHNKLIVPGIGKKLVFSNHQAVADGIYNIADSDNESIFTDSLTVSFSSNGNIDFFPDTAFVFSTNDNTDFELFLRSKRDWYGSDTLFTETSDPLGGIKNDTLYFTVDAVNDPPWINSTIFDAQVNQPYLLQLEVIDKDTENCDCPDAELDCEGHELTQIRCEDVGGTWVQRLTVEAITLPEWLTFDPSSLTLSGIPGTELSRASSSDYYYSLKVSDGELDVDIEDSIKVYAEFEAPITPELFAYAQHEKIVLSWQKESEASIDPVFGHYDFEGYRLYRSLDRGNTWCEGESIIRDDFGDSIACKPYAQFDLDSYGDRAFLMYGSQDTTMRQMSISGFDPYLSRVSLGSNSGLSYSFVDEDVFDGVEYTYSLTAYDTGFRDIDEIQLLDEDEDGIFVRDTLWSTLNPEKILINGKGFKSLESKIGSDNGSIDRGNWDKNFKTIATAKSASNVTYPDTSIIDTFVVPNPQNIGNGKIYFGIEDEFEVEDKFIKFSIVASLSEADVYEGYKTDSPKLYAYEMFDDTFTSVANRDTLFVGEGCLQTFVPSCLFSEAEIDSIRQLPDIIEDMDNDHFIVPQYLDDAFSLMYSDDVAGNTFEDNWYSIFGTRFRFDNSLNLMPDFNVADIRELSAWLPHESILDSIVIDTMLIKNLEIDLKYFSDDVFAKRPPYEYRVEFTDDFYPATPTYSADDDYNTICPTSYLPFRIKNLITGKYVNVSHKDKGIYDGNTAFNPIPSSHPGFRDCFWERNEEIIFTGDSVRTQLNDNYHEETTFSLSLDWDFDFFTLLESSGQWESTRTNYSVDEVVIYEGMFWQASEDIILPAFPNSYMGGHNPWQPLFPWKTGQFIDIKPTRWFVDGDSWTVNLTNVGASGPIDDSSFEDIKVVPNPFFVHSDFETDPTNSKLRFINLPDNCLIKIYTVSGELVDIIAHDNLNMLDGVVNSGSEWWDLVNNKGNMIAPGLYIYVVESSNYEHIGKFAVVR